MPRELTDVELDSELLFVLRQHKGQDNAIQRWNLVSNIFGEDAVYDRGDLNIYDRQVRRCIERMRRAGHIICNLGGGDGYFLAESVDEYQAFRAVYGGRAFQIIETVKVLDQAAGQQWENPLQPRML